MFFDDNYLPRLGDYDQSGCLSYSAILEMLETIGTHHSIAVSDEVSFTEDITWVLVEWQIRIMKRPSLFEPLHGQTWVRRTASSIFSYRGFTVSDESGAECIRASAKFALFDLKSQKMVKISDELFAQYRPETKTVFETDPPHLKEQKYFDETLPIVLRRTDIDYNGHIHNTKYIDYALEAIPKTDYETSAFSQIRVLYRAAVKSGMSIEIKRTPVQDGYLVSIYADGVFSTMIEFLR